MSKLVIVNKVRDLALGDIYEYLPINKIPLKNNIIGMGTTTELNNGELVFIYDASAKQTKIYHCFSDTCEIKELDHKSKFINFPFVCYTTDVEKDKYTVKLKKLKNNKNLKSIVEEGIKQCKSKADYFGIRIKVEFKKLFVSVASNLREWQTNRYQNIEGLNLYQQLTKYSFAEKDFYTDDFTYKGNAVVWDICGFYTKTPEDGYITMPKKGDNLHIHGVSEYRIYGGHILDALSEVKEIKEFDIYPIEETKVIESNLSIRNHKLKGDKLSFEVANTSFLNVNNIDVHIVCDNNYSSRIHQRIPFLSSGSKKNITLSIKDMLQTKPEKIEVIVDPDNIILESNETDNRIEIKI